MDLRKRANCLKTYKLCAPFLFHRFFQFTKKSPMQSIFEWKSCKSESAYLPWDIHQHQTQVKVFNLWTANHPGNPLLTVLRAMGSAITRIVFQPPEPTYSRDPNLIWLNTSEHEAPWICDGRGPFFSEVLVCDENDSYTVTTRMPVTTRRSTFRETNISHLEGAMAGDMLVPWRLSHFQWGIPINLH